MHPDPDPTTLLAEAMVLGTGEAIMRAEKSAQGQLCSSRDVPINGSAILQALGFLLGDKTDKIFRSATWPAGWTQEPTDHAMWSEIRDEHGRKRASVFFKGAFYDREAFVSGPERRFSPRAENTCLKGEGRYDFDASTWIPRVVDGGHTLPRTLILGGPATYDGAIAIARAWLDAYRPSWIDPLAYWDDATADLPAA